MLYAEDLIEGQEFQLGTYAVTEAEILQFARQYDPCQFTLTRPRLPPGHSVVLLRAASTLFAIYQRLVGEAVWSKVAGIVGRSL